MSVQMTTDTHFAAEQLVIFDEWRGFATGNNAKPLFNKDFAIAYDRLICLRDGEYLFSAHSHSNSVNEYLQWRINGNVATQGYTNINDTSLSASVVQTVKRGDYIQLHGVYGEHASNFSSSYITRL